jgi:lipopolysaccharide/colanic/teichoic acid biosynthesis glycosyltransferase
MMANERPVGSCLNMANAFFKRAFDLLCSLIGLVLSGWLIILAWLLASIETKSNGFFVQQRVGRNGKLFYVIKIRTMYKSDEPGTTVTTSRDRRVSVTGATSVIKCSVWSNELCWTKTRCTWLCG